MSQVTIDIAGRSFDVVCQPGEESYLKAAAAMLDEEAQKLNDSETRIPESRMLLMAGLLLADRTAAMEDQLSNGPAVEAPSAEDQAKIADLEARQRASDMEVATLQGRVAELTEGAQSATQQAEEQIQSISNERDSALAALAEMVSTVKSLADT